MRSAESTKKEMRRLDCFFSTESRRRVNHLVNHPQEVWHPHQRVWHASLQSGEPMTRSRDGLGLFEFVSLLTYKRDLIVSADIPTMVSRGLLEGSLKGGREGGEMGARRDGTGFSHIAALRDDDSTWERTKATECEVRYGSMRGRGGSCGTIETSLQKRPYIYSHSLRRPSSPSPPSILRTAS